MNAEFFHHLHDTIVLLGGGTRIAKMVERYDRLTESDADELRDYNANLIALTKDKLANIHKLKIRASDE
ncbi:MAG TPA: hypothetical protein VND64_07190 [Pirellulales bacterium]|nr:hypothetical protein [Pirellulales bacterium]